MTDQDAKLKLVQKIERATSDFGIPHKPGLALFLATKLLEDIPGLMAAVKSGVTGKVT